MDASLVRQADRAGQVRFSLLGTIRDYAAERLHERGQWQEAHDRHAAHFLALGESARAGLEGPGQVAWLDRLEVEHDNLGAAMSWFLDQDQPALAHQLGAVTWRFWWFRGHAEEFAGDGEAIVANAEKLPPGQLSYAQNGLGLMLIASGDPERAQVLFEQALALSAARTSWASRSAPVRWATWRRCAANTGRPPSCWRRAWPCIRNSATTYPSPWCTTSSARSRSARVTPTPRPGCSARAWRRPAAFPTGFPS